MKNERSPMNRTLVLTDEDRQVEIKNYFLEGYNDIYENDFM